MTFNETIISQLQFAQWAALRNLEGVTHEESVVRPSGGANDSNWVLGHVIAVRNRIIAAVGEAPLWDDARIAPYVAASTDDTSARVPLDELRDAFAATFEKMTAGIARLDDDALSQKAPFSPGSNPDETLRSLLALSDVMGTGHHAVVSAHAQPGDTVAIVGDGAVGLCSVIAAKRLDAGRIIALSRNPQRQALAREFGATDIVAERGDQAIAAVLALTGGVGADAVAECVGTGDAFSTAVAIARPGSTVGYVGVPHGVEVPIDTLFHRNIGIKGGSAPVRAYLPELLDDVLAERINPGRVFDFETDLDGIAAAYAAMDERRAIKSLVRVGTLA